jgi:Na+-driven multidrug efflux pump
LTLLDVNVEFNILLCCMLSFMFLTLQNIAVTYLTTIKKYIHCSLFQICFALLKGGVTLLCLRFITNSVDYFVYSQLFTAVIGYFVIRYLCKDSKVLQSDKSFFGFRELIKLLKRGFPVLISSVSAAVIMQLDKSSISYFNPSEVLTPYFFAFTYCMSPILIVAQPIKQYFHPLIKFSISKGVRLDIVHSIRSYIVINTSLVFFVFSVLYLFNQVLLVFWLDDVDLAESVYQYTSVLLPSLAFASISYVPVVILTCLEDFYFQAKVNAIMALIVFLFTVYYSVLGDIGSIVLVYSIYFFIISIFCWLRLLFLYSNRIGLIKDL